MLDELERLERAATPVPIGIDRDGEIFPLDADGEYIIQGEIAAMCSDNPNDGPLFVAARNALPALLRVARAAKEWERAQAAYTAWFQSGETDESGRAPEGRLNRAEDALRGAVEALRNANLHHHS